jgi:chorismate mutase
MVSYILGCGLGTKSKQKAVKLIVRRQKWSKSSAKMILEVEDKGFSEELILRIFKAIHQESILHQEKIINS